MGTPASTTDERDRWLLLHGTPLTPDVWTPLLAHLPRGDLVVRPDITPDATPGETQAALMARVRAVLAPAPGPVHVVGHSFGGQVALDLALTEPDRVRSLTIICSRDTPYAPFAAAALALRDGTQANIDATLARWFRPRELAGGGPVLEYARRCLAQADHVSWARALDSIAAFDRTAAVSRILVPVTLIAAEFDQVSPPAVMRAFAERLPNARLHVLDGAAHMSPFLDPPALARRIVDAARRADPRRH